MVKHFFLLLLDPTCLLSATNRFLTELALLASVNPVLQWTVFSVNNTPNYKAFLAYSHCTEPGPGPVK